MARKWDSEREDEIQARMTAHFAGSDPAAGTTGAAAAASTGTTGDEASAAGSADASGVPGLGLSRTVYSSIDTPNAPPLVLQQLMARQQHVSSLQVTLAVLMVVVVCVCAWWCARSGEWGLRIMAMPWLLCCRVACTSKNALWTPVSSLLCCSPVALHRSRGFSWGP